MTLSCNELRLTASNCLRGRHVVKAERITPHGIPRLVVMPSVRIFAVRYVVKGATSNRDRSKLAGYFSNLSQR